MDKDQVSAAPADREAWMKEAERLAHEMQRKYHNAMVWSSRENAEDPPPAKAAWQEYQAARALLLLHISTAAPAVQQDGWMPIESAPKNRKVLVAYKNSLGKWRRVMASYATAADIEEAGEDSGYGDTGAKPGWYEECESQKTIMPVEGEPELWHELPPIDAAADHIADAGEMVAAPVAAPAAEASADECIDLACALEQRRALKIVDDVHNLRIGGRAEVMPTAFHAGYCLACEEIEHRLRTEQWGIDGAPVPLFGTSAPAAEAQLRQLPGEPEEEYLGRRAEAQTLEPTWVLLLRHGMSPVRKGPFFADAPIEQMVRDLYALHSDATVIVINMPVTAYPMSGREWVAMHGDRRCKAIPGAPSPQRPMVMPSHSEPGFVKPDTDQHVFFYEQDFYVLSNFSAFNLRWQGRTFPTSEHAYHWMKFPTLTRDEEGRYVRDHIFRAPSAHEAFKLAERWKSLRRPDWDAAKVDIMRDILRAKAAQHEYVRRKLLATGDRELIEDSWRDNFWGWGPNRDGQNMLGKLWMEVRAELRAAKNGAAVAPKENNNG
jgi:ribA/ribD-fused uncharacterized protein